MAGQFDVSTTAMQTSQQRVVTNVADIRSELSALSGKLAGLQGQWIGDGSTAFVSAQARYEAANQKLNTALDTISNLLQQGLTGYVNRDDDAKQTLTAAGSAMDVQVPGF